MAKEARHHHYIPQCYLRGFTVGSGKRRRVTVANLASRRFFETNPRNVGGVRDFNRINIEGFAPDALEGMLAHFEGEVATAIRNVAESHRFEGNDRNAILNLITLLAIRSPQQRENIRQFEEQLMKQVLGLSLATKERWESQLSQMKKAGYEVNEALSYEDMVAFYKKDEYDIRLNNEHYIALETKTHDALLKVLAQRKWKLHVATEDKGCFVTTDRPVVITWNHPEEIPVMMRASPGFGMTDTEVLFPVTQHLLLLGTFEGEDGTVEAVPELVAVANLRTIEHSYGNVYTPKKVFPYVGPDRKCYHDRHFMERFDSLLKEREKSEEEAAKSASHSPESL